MKFSSVDKKNTERYSVRKRIGLI